MKYSLDMVQWRICDTQQDIYKIAALSQYDMKAFSDAYLSSVFCERQMDSSYSRYQFSYGEECMDFITPEIGEFKSQEYVKNDKMFSMDVAEWIGWTYRQIQIITKIPSKKLKDYLSFDELCRYYPGMHTILEDYAAEDMIRNMVKKHALPLDVTPEDEE